jgi:hypothetical protein
MNELEHSVGHDTIPHIVPTTVAVTLKQRLILEKKKKIT